jgi:predicted nuclease of restriction endonuclease-like (RecB) superfamily
LAKRAKPGQQLTPAAKRQSSAAVPGQLLEDLRALIQRTREGVAQAVNSALVLLYWQVGRRIHTAILSEKRAAYGEQIVPTLSAQLVPEFGDGFIARNLFRMIRFAEVFPNQEIVSTLSRQLGWSHFVEIIPLDDDLKREFYAEMCRVERWSVRTLRAKIQSMLFERTALSRKPAELAIKELAALREEDRLTPDLVFRDPYFLDFLGLADTYSEKELEAAILRAIQHVLLELGGGFAFIDRQKRIVVDGEDFDLDLLFDHRRLRCRIAIDLLCGSPHNPLEGDQAGEAAVVEEQVDKEAAVADLQAVALADEGEGAAELQQELAQVGQQRPLQIRFRVGGGEVQEINQVGVPEHRAGVGVPLSHRR